MHYGRLVCLYGFPDFLHFNINILIMSLEFACIYFKYL